MEVNCFQWLRARFCIGVNIGCPDSPPDILKPLSFSILRLLTDDGFRSGEEIAHLLGISRASVWQALRDIDQHGIRLFRLPGRGYRLAQPLQWLDAARVRRELGAKAALLDLEVVEVAESSNTVLMQKAALGAGHGSCLVVELQTRGRGRRGRQWQAGLGSGLTFSLLWRFNCGAGYLSGLSLAVGVALVRALEQAGVAAARLKWPNDVMHREHKLAGILIELQGDMLGPSTAVIGIGLNLRLPSHLRANIDQPAADLASTGAEVPERNRMLALILAHLVDVLQQFEASGFAALREEWSRHHAFHGRPVRMLMPDGGEHHGTVAGVAEDGALLVRDAAGERRFTAGEISLRGEP